MRQLWRLDFMNWWELFFCFRTIYCCCCCCSIRIRTPRYGECLISAFSRRNYFQITFNSFNYYFQDSLRKNLKARHCATRRVKKKIQYPDASLFLSCLLWGVYYFKDLIKSSELSRVSRAILNLKKKKEIFSAVFSTIRILQNKTQSLNSIWYIYLYIYIANCKYRGVAVKGKIEVCRGCKGRRSR